MKFSVFPGISNSGSKSRLGRICDLPRLPNVEFNTPMLLLRTKGGSVSHLTREVLRKVTDTVEGLQIPLSNAFKCYEGMKTYNGNISEFVGLKEHLSFCTLQDPGVKTPSGFNIKNSVSIWTSFGRTTLTPESYMDMIETFQPDLYEVLSDSDCNATSSTKRIRKSSDHSSEFLGRCLSRHQTSEKLKKSAVLGVVVGGYNFKSREFYVESLKKHFDSLGGFVITGLHSNGPEVELIELATVSPIISHTLKLLPEDKLRLVYGAWHPEVVIGLIELGVDLFDSSIVDIVTDRYSAFTFHWKAIPRSKPVMNGILSPINHNTDKEEIPAVKKPENKLEICLKDKIYFDDFTPILEGCKCLTCRNHTKAYVHHLFNTRELLGPVLLTIHNLHHYMEFFAFIRSSLQSGNTVGII